MGATAVLPPIARSTSREEAHERRLRFLHVQGCRCCKQEFHRALITGRPRARSRFGELACEKNRKALSATGHQRGGASRRYCRKEHRREFDRTAREFHSIPVVWSSPDKRFWQC